MKKALAIAISLAASSSAFASDSKPLNIKFSNFSDDSALHCLYSTVVSHHQCSIEAVACSDSDQFTFNDNLEKGKKYLGTVLVRNEETQEVVADGAVAYSFGNGNNFSLNQNDNFSISAKYGLDNINYYHTEEGVEFFLRPTEAVMLYNQESYQGDFIEVVRNLNDLGEFSDDVDSYTIPEGWSLRFYREKNLDHTQGYYTRGALRHGSVDGADYNYPAKSIRIIRTAEDIEQARWEDRNRSANVISD